MTIVYKTKTASAEQIFSHMRGCEDSFIGPLAARVDLRSYSQKMFDHSVTFEAWEGEDLVGLVSAYFNDRKKRSGYVTNVSTKKAHQGKGIAAALLKICVAYAEARGFSTISLEVAHDNTPAVTLYAKLGFKTEKVAGDSVFMRYDVGMER